MTEVPLQMAYQVLQFLCSHLLSNYILYLQPAKNRNTFLVFQEKMARTNIDHLADLTELVIGCVFVAFLLLLLDCLSMDF